MTPPDAGPDFRLSPETEAVRARVHDFVDEHLLPLESDRDNFDAHENIAREPLARVRAAAKSAGLWAPQMPPARGGMGLSTVARAVFYEEANRSIFGPVAFHCAAPDDGNMSVLEKVATAEQKARWLQPIVDGEVASAFAMTEPAPGGGSDPSMIRTSATRDGDDWVVHGRKWYITGAGEAAHFVLIARTDPDPDERRRHLSAFLFHRDDPGWEIVRRIPIMGPEEHGGHCELAFDGLRIPDGHRLMERRRGAEAHPDPARAGPSDTLHALARARQAVPRRSRASTWRSARASASDSPSANRCG